jgi:hypothetical protein
VRIEVAAQGDRRFVTERDVHVEQGSAVRVVSHAEGI